VRPLSKATAVSTALALIVLPLVALFIKFTAPGWLLLAMLFISPLIVLGYAIQVVIAITGYLSPRAALRAEGSWRSVLASWLTSVAVVLFAFFLMDVSDVPPPYSPFTLMLGYDEVDPGLLGDISSAACAVAAMVCIGAWVWLMIEWVVALVRRRRAAVLSAPLS
jgi:hypothetical protein